VVVAYLRWLEASGSSRSYRGSMCQALVITAKFLFGGSVHGGVPPVLDALREHWAATKAHVTKRRFRRRDHVYTAQLRGRGTTELGEFRAHLVTEQFRTKAAKVSSATADKHVLNARRALGWYQRRATEAAPAAAPAALADLVPSSDEDGAGVAFEYCRWLQDTRAACRGTLRVYLSTFIRLARYLHPEAGRCVEQLRVIGSGRLGPAVSDVSKKWLPYERFVQCVEQLRQECRVLLQSGRRRKGRAVLQSWQRYLIAAILAAIPDRQRTLRELTLGRTLVKSDGVWSIVHAASDYKTGKFYGDRPALTLPARLSEDIDCYLQEWRPKVRCDHLFVCTKGRPLRAACVHQTLATAVFRMTGQLLNPHLVRHMVVTHVRTTDGVTEAQLEGVAFLMGHSLDTQRKHYTKLTPAERVGPGIALMHSIAAQ